MQPCTFYGNWGGLPAVSHAQLEQGSNWGLGVWHESALGINSEAASYNPAGQSSQMITALRPESVCGESSTARRPCEKYSQNVNAGGGSFMAYFNGTYSYQYMKQVRSAYPGGVGPCLTNVSYAGVSADGAIEQEAGVALGRTDRYTKLFHTIRTRVTKDTTASRLAFYQTGDATSTFNGIVFGAGAADLAPNYVPESVHYAAAPFTYLAAHDRKVCGGAGATGGYASGSCWAYMPSKSPADLAAVPDRGMVIRSWSAVLGGQPVAQPSLSLYKTSTSAVSLEISPPAGVTELRAGDYVDAQVELLVLPAKAADYYGTDAELRVALQALDDELATANPVLRSTPVVIEGAVDSVLFQLSLF